MISTPEQMREGILTTCFIKYDGQLSNGDNANNKLDLDLLAENPELEAQIIYGLGSMAVNLNPDYIAGVPQGGSRLADRVSANFDLPQIVLKKVEDEDGYKYIAPAADYEDKKINHAQSIVVIEDVVRTGKNVRLAVSAVGRSKLAGVIAVFDRSPYHPSRADLSVNSLVEESIPELIAPNSEYKYYLSE